MRETSNRAHGGDTRRRRCNSQLHSLNVEGFEAPRNSLDGASSVETNAHEFEDVAFGYGFCNQASDKRWNRDARDEKKLRAPNVVARLMGLNAMSELLPTHNSSQKMPKNGADPVAKSRKIPVRDDHPQEAELQRFKHEFAAKQHLDDMKRQLEEKKRKVRATLDKARLALSQGIIASSPKLGKEFENSNEFLEALEFLQCNKDFIFQFLQQKPNAVFSNNETTPPVTKKGKQGIQGIQGTQATQRTQAKQAAKAISDSAQRGFSPRSLARLFMHSDSRKGNDHNKLNSIPGIEGRTAQSPTAIHRSSSRDVIPEDVKCRTPTSTSSRYMLPTSPKSQVKQATKGSTNKRNSARDVIAEIKERLRRREHQPNENIHCTKKLPNSKAREPAASSPKTTNFTLTKSLSTGKRISMLRSDVDDGEEISYPKKVLLSDYLADSPPATLRAKVRKTKTKTSSTQASESNLKKPNATQSNHLRLDSPGKKKLLHCVNEAAPSPKSVKSSHQKPNASRSNLVKLDNPGKKRFLHSVHDAASSPNLARCRSVPNAAMLRGNCTNAVDVAQNATTPKVLKPARNTQNGTEDGTQNSDKRMFSVDSKKVNKVGHETSESMPSPSRVSALAESCVSQRMESNAGSKVGKDANAKVRRNILDHVKDGQDATSDKNGRDSPVVSVLEPPFQVFKDITNAHQDPLRIRLRRPKRDRSSERVRDNESDETREKHQDTLRSSEVPPPSQTQTPAPQITPKRPSPSRPSPVSDFAFVRDILVASGFHTHGGRNITQWHSSTQPISPHLLKKMQTTSRTISTRSSHHRILFDAINEILITNLELSSAATPAHRCFGLPIVTAPRNAAVSGRRFVEDVWSEIRKRKFSTASRENGVLLHSLVAQEVQPTNSWLLLRRHVDRICLQVEKAVWEELVEEGRMHLLHQLKLRSQ